MCAWDDGWFCGAERECLLPLKNTQNKLPMSLAMNFHTHTMGFMGMAVF